MWFLRAVWVVALFGCAGADDDEPVRGDQCAVIEAAYLDYLERCGEAPTTASYFDYCCANSGTCDAKAWPASAIDECELVLSTGACQQRIPVACTRTQMDATCNLEADRVNAPLDR